MVNQSSFDCIIIGAGISGLIAAKILQDQGLHVAVLEKSRGLGGRMATRRMGTATIDHGAQFFTTASEPFQKQTEEWMNNHCVQAWHTAENGLIRYRGLPGMTAIAKTIGHQLTIFKEHLVQSVHWESNQWKVECTNENSYHADKLISTAPVPQLLHILKKSGFSLQAEEESLLQSIQYAPTLALLALLEGPSGLPEPGMLKFTDHPILQTIADNQVKGVSRTPALTVHSSHDFARTHLEELNETTAQPLIQATQTHVKSSITEWSLHRWRYAHCETGLNQDYFKIKGYPLWLAGDAFGPPKIEGAALSGLKTAQHILELR